MCGIIAYKGPRRPVSALVIKGLKRLEYRGYDSWGVVLKKTNGKLSIKKKTGKISDVDAGDKSFQEGGTIAMAHSRWATHGGVTQKNAHPHGSCTNGEGPRMVVIHNGIIENYLEIKQKLLRRGHRFVSETDTEVAAHLIEENLRKKPLGKASHDDLRNAVIEALRELQGRYAFVIMCADTDLVIGARRGSPLIVGVGSDEHFIASDIPAFLEYTNRVMYLDDNEIVVLGHRPSFYSAVSGEEVPKRIVAIALKPHEAEKGDFPHFMIKEIFDQKETIYRTIQQDDRLLATMINAMKKAYGTYFIGCGTAGKVCMAATYLFSKIANKHVNMEFGSEFGNFQHFIQKKSLLIAVSQSGETADTLEAMEVGREKGSRRAAIVNTEGSSIDRMADISIYLKVGPEKAVASTKATTAQLAIITLLAYFYAGRLREGRKLLLDTAGHINDMLNPRYEEHILKLAKKIKHVESMYVIGRGVNYPMALEAAIKLQEVSYIHAEGFAGGELKHGPIALISKGTPCVVLVANDETKKDILSNAMEIRARGGYIIGVSPTKEAVFDYWIRVPDVSDASPIVNIIPIQMLAYLLAVLRKCNPDMPRNLAKSVTVK